jgi:hypothetical protein
MDDDRRLQVTEYFKARLAEEARRSERYGRPFSVLFVSCRQTDPHDIFNSLRPHLRCTDIVEIIRPRPQTVNAGIPPASNPKEDRRRRVRDSGDEAARDRVAMILPETGRAGAEVTLARLRSQCSRLRDLNLGLAVYPEDSTNPQELVPKAASSAGESFRP